MPNVFPDVVDETCVVAVLARAVEEARMDLTTGLAHAQVLVLELVLSQVFFKRLLWLDPCLLSLGSKLGILSKVVLDAHVAVLTTCALQGAFKASYLAQLAVEFSFTAFELLLEVVDGSITLAELSELEDACG